MLLRQAQIVLLAGMAVVCGLMLVAPAGAADGYEYHVHGDPGDVERSTIGRLVLIGGGRDAGFRWMIGGSGGGDFVVIRASGGADYNGYARGLGAVDSLETLAIRDRPAASDTFVGGRVADAEAIFFAGRDQGRYLRLFGNTPLEDAVNASASRGVPVGGTSGGLAVLGELAYSA